MLVSPLIPHRYNDAKPICRCLHKKVKLVAHKPWEKLKECTCGDDNDTIEWKWLEPPPSESSWVVLSENNLLAKFHPVYSSGTACVKGDTPMVLNYHYYWEIKMLTDTYGTDIMIGIATDKLNTAEYHHKFGSPLGHNSESYGLSYTGTLRHDGQIISRDNRGFCRGSIIGVRLNQWDGTMEFYINRQPQGISFFNLRRHPILFPAACSTAAQSCMKIVYASSWKASLMVDALKILAASLHEGAKLKLPPNLWHALKKEFWLVLPYKGSMNEEEIYYDRGDMSFFKCKRLSTPAKRRRHWQLVPLGPRLDRNRNGQAE